MAIRAFDPDPVHSARNYRVPILSREHPCFGILVDAAEVVLNVLKKVVWYRH